ncbi:MAG: nuclear transport factor 2 family protein [Gemmatimonadaceae bacterium]|nr:nuclear transport factor 2 family protein [Gemmatimonadaceae bacterium]
MSVADEVSFGVERLHAVLDGPPDAEILALEARLRAAQLAADVTALDVLLSDDLLFTGPDGRLATKADDLGAHGSGAVRFRVHRPTALAMRRVGANVCVTVLRAYLEVEVGGAVMRGPVRYTRVWAREGDSVWRVVAGQVSAVPSDGDDAVPS